MTTIHRWKEQESYMLSSMHIRTRMRYLSSATPQLWSQLTFQVLFIIDQYNKLLFLDVSHRPARLSMIAPLLPWIYTQVFTENLYQRTRSLKIADKVFFWPQRKRNDSRSRASTLIKSSTCFHNETNIKSTLLCESCNAAGFSQLFPRINIWILIQSSSSLSSSIETRMFTRERRYLQK